MGNQLVGYHICEEVRKIRTNGVIRAEVCRLLCKGPNMNIVGVACHNYLILPNEKAAIDYT